MKLSHYLLSYYKYKTKENNFKKTDKNTQQFKLKNHNTVNEKDNENEDDDIKFFIVNPTKYTVRDVIANNIHSKKNELLLMCMLSSAVYRYSKHKLDCTEKHSMQHNETVINESEDISDADHAKEFHKICDSWNLHSDISSIHNIDNELIFGIFLIDKRLVISFKGSSTVNDFLNDIDIIEVPFNLYEIKNKINIDIPGRVHRGGYDILFENHRYTQILQKIDEYIKVYINDDNNFEIQNICITGHSLGALVGTIFYAFFKHMTERVLMYENINLELITFGSPRVGNKTFINCLQADDFKSTRIVNGNDIVTRLPLPIFYRHLPKLFCIGSPRKCYAPSLNDHFLSNYYNSILDYKMK